MENMMYLISYYFLIEVVTKAGFTQHAHIFVLSLVSKRYQTLLISTMTLEGVCKINPRR
jgi:hypothetical protein